VEESRELSEKGFSCRGGMTTWKVLDDRDATRRHFGEVIEDKPRFKKGGWDHQERQVKAGDDDGGESRPAKKAKVEGQEGDKEDPCGETKAAEEAKREPKNGKMSEDGTYIIPVYDDSPEKWSSESMIADCNKEGLWEFKTHSDVPSHLTASIPKGLFPPTPAEASRMGLEKCMRIMPQDMDTGGFFVTVLRKTKAIGSIKRKQQNKQEEGREEEEAAEPAAAAAAAASSSEKSQESSGGGVRRTASSITRTRRSSPSLPPSPHPSSTSTASPAPPSPASSPAPTQQRE
jgi:hypothetical protein